MSRLPDEHAAWEQAAYATVHGFVGRGGRRGAAALAPVLNMTPRSISNMVNPDVDTAAHGDTDGEIKATLADRRIEAGEVREVREVRRRLHEEFRAGLELLARMEALQEPETREETR